MNSGGSVAGKFVTLQQSMRASTYPHSLRWRLTVFSLDEAREHGGTLATLGALVRGDRGALEKASEHGLVVRREDDCIEVHDPDFRTLMGLLPGRFATLIYYIDAGNNSFETILLDDISILENIELDDIVERREDSTMVRPPSLWLQLGDPNLEKSRGRICYVTNNMAKCKSL